MAKRVQQPAKEKEKEEIVNVGELSKVFLQKFMTSNGTREEYNALINSEWESLLWIERYGFNEDNSVLEELLSFVLLYIRVECADEGSFNWNMPEIDTIERLLTSVKHHLSSGHFFCVAQYYRNFEYGNLNHHTELTVVNQTLRSCLTRYCLLLCAALELKISCDDILFPLACKIFSAASSTDYLNPYSTLSLSTICSVPILEPRRSIELSLFLKNTLLPAFDQSTSFEIPRFNLHLLIAKLISSNL